MIIESEVSSMNMFLYLIGVFVVIYIFFAILPVLLPLILILVVLFSIFIWNLKRKVRKHMNQYENDYSGFSNGVEDDTYTTYSSSKKQTSTDQDIIDVEFTETDQSDHF